MKHTLSFMVWAILAILLPLQMAQAAAPPTELQKRLQNFPDISDIKPMQVMPIRRNMYSSLINYWIRITPKQGISSKGLFSRM